MIAGRYRLEREIGRGGTGPVWLGRDEVLGRRVALKRIGLLPGADRTDLARAEREARLSAHLNHPNVVTVFDVVHDRATDDRWLVMEYVEGITLAQLVRDEGPLTPDQAAPLLWQAAHALAAAHRAGIVHRDVKPSNILLDERRQVRLTDFGIARGEAEQNLTQTGLLTGSPAYLAPEVVTGGRPGEAADVWSLGATAFHVLAGRPPYDVGGSVMGALYRIVHEEPPRLPEAGWLTPMLDGMMVRDPSQRWTLQQVCDHLAHPHRSTAPVAVAAPTNEQPAGLGRHRRPVVAVAVVAVLALVLGAAVYAALSGGGSGSRRAAGPSTSASPSTSPSPSPTRSATPRPRARPTSQGMAAFIRRYVATVARDPDAAWTMLTPKFQRESGGIGAYRAHWDRATNGRVLSVTADPTNLTVSYQVRFDNLRNGPGRTLLDLTFDHGRYRIDGEHSAGFVPAG